MKILSETDPQHILPSQVAGMFGTSLWFAYRLCKEGVREGKFTQHEDEGGVFYRLVKDEQDIADSDESDAEVGEKPPVSIPS